MQYEMWERMGSVYCTIFGITMEYQLPLSHIHLELTTKCNAACPMCMRNLFGDREHPSLNRTDFDIRWMDNFDVPIDKLTLCGNYGDPCVHPELHSIIKQWLETYNKPIIMMTNGGARTPDYWAKIAEMAGDKIKIIFGIDGLSDTNHLYRRNVIWSKLMKNAQAFIDAGGNAQWKYIIFDHNKHQIEQARELAGTMGFTNFEQIKTNRFELDHLPVFDKDGKELYRLYEPTIEDTGFTSKNKYRSSVTKEWTGQISCYALNESSVYIAADGRAYPCCNTGYHYNLDRSLNREVEDLNILHSSPNISNTKLSKLLDSDFFNAIQNKWNNNPLKKCKKTCGILRDNLHKVERLERV